MMLAGLEIPTWLFAAIVVIAVWDGVWKLIGMWKAARKNSVVWFLLIGLINSAGILPILYIYVFSETKRKRRKR